MKITILAANTKKPLANAEVQLQIRGKDTGFHTFKTDASGQITLDEKFKDHQITSTMGGTQGAWIKATDGATLMVGMAAGAAFASKGKEKQPTSSR